MERGLSKHVKACFRIFDSKASTVGPQRSHTCPNRLFVVVVFDFATVIIANVPASAISDVFDSHIGWMLAANQYDATRPIDRIVVGPHLYNHSTSEIFYAGDARLFRPAMHWLNHRLKHSCTVVDTIAITGTSCRFGSLAIANGFDHYPSTS